MKFTPIIILAMASGLTAVPAIAAPHLASHRAVYDLELKSAKERGGIRGVDGRMVIEMEGSSCEGWSVQFRLVNDFQLSKGRNRLVDTRSSSWESGDGMQLQYVEDERVDSRQQDKVRLTVRRNNMSEKAIIKQSQPKPGSYTLPANTYFPIQHQKHLIEVAMAGQMRDKSIVYDGSNGKKTFQAISFIGKKKHLSIKDMKLKGNGKSLVDGINYWPVSISYFPTDDNKDSDVPAYQVSFVMFENGVAGNLVLDYGDFAMKGSLVQLDKLEQTPCRQ